MRVLKELASARHARYAADILPSPSAFLNDSAYGGFGPLSALASTATGASGLFQWPTKASHDNQQQSTKRASSGDEDQDPGEEENGANEKHSDRNGDSDEQDGNGDGHSSKRQRVD